ncbi:unnamed protein product [Larinioides sclopetarius]
MSFKPKQTESKEETSANFSGLQFTASSEHNIKPSFFEYTRINESSGLIELDIEKLERNVSSLNLDRATEDDPSQKAIYVQMLKEKILKYSETLEKDEPSPKQTEPEECSNTEEQNTEKLTPYKFERKNKLWDRKPHLREMSKEALRHKFTEEDLETSSKCFINRVESELNPAVNILRRIAYPKLCEKHFSSEFCFGAFVKEDEPVENISISVDHFEFLHKELPIDFWQLFESRDFYNVASVWEKDPQINNMVPSFIEFLQNNSEFQFPEKCFTLILAILKNPYRKFEYFYDNELPVIKEQIAITEYLLSCLHILKILDDKDAFEKLAEAIIMFANIHPSLHALILGGFNTLFSNHLYGLPAYQIYCKVLNIMTSIGATFICLCLPHHFKKLSCLAAKDRNCDLYFHLLRACEISIASIVEYDSQIKAESSDEVDLDLFYNACYNYFGRDLTTRLMPVFRKYENRKNREEQYLSRKHSIFPTKDGYMDIEMRFLTNRIKIRAESESSNIPRVKECTFNSAGKVLFSSSNAQLGYVIQEDMHELSVEDVDYWATINDFPLSYLEGITDRLAKNN